MTSYNGGDHRLKVLSLCRKLIIASKHYPSQTAPSLPRDIILTFQDDKHLDIETDKKLIGLKLQQAKNGLNNLSQYVPQNENSTSTVQRIKFGWFE